MNKESDSSKEENKIGQHESGLQQRYQINNLAREVVHTCMKNGIVLTTVESCTGGWLSTSITGIHGASAIFDRGFIVYSNRAKVEMLGLDEKLIVRHGAVSSEVAEYMAQGGLDHSDADVSISITGISGPSGGSKDKPVGLVYHCCHQRGEVPIIVRNIFNGDREAIRRQSVIKALELIIKIMV